MAVKFDISQIPSDSDADIIEATYSMLLFWGDTAQQGDPNVCSLFTISRHWVDTEVTWNNADKNTVWENTDPDTKFYNPMTGDTSITPGGCDFTRENQVIADYAKLNDWENYNVTDIVKKMHKSQIPNHGFMIKQFVCIETAQGKDPKLRYNWGKSYWASEYEKIEKRPKLTVKYEQASIHSNTVMINQKTGITIQKNAGNIRMYIPFTESYHIFINDIKGRELLSFEGNGEKCISLPRALSSGIVLIKADIKEKSIKTRFLLVQ